VKLMSMKLSLVLKAYTSMAYYNHPSSTTDLLIIQAILHWVACKSKGADLRD
jgi:hypothetical protein